MNKQIGYITSAHLLLFGIAASYFFISKISAVPDQGRSVSDNYIEGGQPKALSEAAAKGKTVFLQRCASCHNVFRDIGAPALAGFESRGPWADRNKLYEWIRDPKAFMEKDPYTKQLKQKYGLLMNVPPDITTEEIDLVATYIEEVQ